MIFQCALQRELINTAIAVFASFVMIILTIMLVKTLGQAANGNINLQDILTLIGFQFLNYIPQIFILTSFISVLLVIMRSYQDAEVIIWFIAGLSLMNWIKPVLRFGWPIILLTGLFSFIITPWANQHNEKFRKRYEKCNDISYIISGKFQESISAKRVLFVENVFNNINKLSNIFIYTFHNKKNSIVLAKSGKIEIDQYGKKFVVMNKGQRYDYILHQLDFKMIKFKYYNILVDSQLKNTVSKKLIRSLSSLDLLIYHTSLNKSELLWRITLSIMPLILMLLAIPLSFFNSRASKSVNLFIALLLFIFYSNTINIVQSAVMQGLLSLVFSLLSIHILLAIIIALLFLWHLKINSRLHPLALLARIQQKIFLLK